MGTGGVGKVIGTSPLSTSFPLRVAVYSSILVSQSRFLQVGVAVVEVGVTMMLVVVMEEDDSCSADSNVEGESNNGARGADCDGNGTK